VGVVDIREGLVDDIWRLASDLVETRSSRQPRARPGGGSAAAAPQSGAGGGPSAAARRQNFTARVDEIFRSFQREVHLNFFHARTANYYIRVSLQVGFITKLFYARHLSCLCYYTPQTPGPYCQLM